jgi:hypothetical protein
MECHLSKGSIAAVFLSITIIALASACEHGLSTPEGATTASNEISHALIGKQITIHGKFSMRGKVGPYVVLDNQQVVYLVSKDSFTWGKSYSEMEGKLVATTGTLRFYQAPPAESTDRSVARLDDYFYFEAETVELRLIGN